MDFLSAIAFLGIVIPLFYLGVGALSLSRLVNRPLTDLSTTYDQSSLSGESAESGETGGGLLDTSKRVLTVFLAMTLALAAFALIAALSENLLVFVGTALGLAIVWLLFAVQLNPEYSSEMLWLATGVVAAILGLRWSGLSTWVTDNAVQFLVVTGIMLMHRTIRPRLLGIASAGLFLYDVVHVYGTGLMMRVVEHPGGAETLAIVVPTSGNDGTQGALLAGLGDIALPGVWMMLAFRVAAAHRRYSLVGTTLLGIMAGWVAAVVTNAVTGHPVPALLFLVPGAAMGYFSVAIPTRLDEKRARASA